MESKITTRRAVAIVGRPNVGKSAIFNRLAGRRVAIVHAEHGITRDRLIAEVQWEQSRFELIDTAGIGRGDWAADEPAAQQAEMEGAVRRQMETAVEDAAVILLVVDINRGLLPQDEEIAAGLRKSARTILLVANKADHPERDLAAAEFARLGLPVFPVSALHNRGLAPLLRRVSAALPAGANRTLQDPLKVAFVGRPNVGKSSVINSLLRDERVIVSAQPGTTRDSIDIPFVVGDDALARHYILTDTAGIRRRRSTRGLVERLSLRRTERSIIRADVVGLVLDAAQGPTAHDKTILAQILAAHKGCVLVVNKWDLLSTTAVPDYLAALRRALPFGDFIPVVFVAAKTGWQMRRLVETLDQVGARLQAQLPTGVLNRVIHAAYQRTLPPLVGGKRLKIFYAAQVSSQPLVLTRFVNDPQLLVMAYRNYLLRCLRSAFGLQGVPLVLRLKARRP